MLGGVAMKHYRIRRGSIAYYATKPITLILIISIIMGVFILTSNANADTNIHKLYITSGYYESNDLIVTDDGNLWECSVDDSIRNGCPVLITFNNNGTESIHDDIIIDVAPQNTHWNIPLTQDLQAYIIYLCEEYNIAPELVIAVIQEESNYNTDAIGDNGTSFGLMQVREMYHERRMHKLGCTNLLDPYQNVTVGIDILSEKLNKYDTIEEALTAYNAGDAGAYELYFSKGIKANDYALEVMEIAENLQ